MRQQITSPVAGAPTTAVPAERPGTVAARIRRFNAGIESAVLREMRLARLKQAAKGRAAR
jgi:hypothetical protein